MTLRDPIHLNDCVKCNGTGRSKSGVPCHMCAGRGMVVVPPPVKRTTHGRMFRFTTSGRAICNNGAWPKVTDDQALIDCNGCKASLERAEKKGRKWTEGGIT